MKKIDVRFSASDMEILKSLVSRKMDAYKCDPFLFSTGVYGIVGISCEDVAIGFTNLIESTDYFGEQEDVAVFRMKEMPFQEIHSLVQEQEMVVTPVNSIISRVDIVNEHQKLFEGDAQTFDVWITRGVIFYFDDGHELSFEKNIWFSEDISVEKGYHVIQRFTPLDEFEEGWSGNFRGECSREVIVLQNN